MNLILKRSQYTKNGIFGDLLCPDGSHLCVTLEHAYPYTQGRYIPKLPPGSYLCKRGQHQLHSGPIETFEITGVVGHVGILFHPGNSESDSEGCVLLGLASMGSRISASREAFSKFMVLQAGNDTFQLNVTDATEA